MSPRIAKGSALITVLMLVGVMAVMTAFLLKYGISERSANERQRLILRSRNMSENVALYASEQITNKLYKLRSTSKMAFLGTNAVTLPPDDVLTTAYSAPSDAEVYAGILDPGSLVYLDPNDPVNATNPNAGLQVSTSAVPIVTKSTMSSRSVGSVTTYAEQMLEVAMMPLFQFAIFFNMDLEFGPGPNMTISGPVHTNGDFIARIQTGFANTLRFTDRVTSAKGFYANTAHRGSTYMADGSVDSGPGGTGPLYFRKPSEDITAGTNIKSSSGVWRDHKWGGSSETATTISQFRSFATSTYAGNLRTSAHGVTDLVLPAIGKYDESTEEGRKNGRQIIEAPLTSDAGGLLGTKFGRNAGLYIMVNPDDTDRTGRLPNGSAVTLRARSYRAFINSVSGSTNTTREVVLPGQPSYRCDNGTPADLTDDILAANNRPNAYRNDTSVGHNQVLRIPQGGAPDFGDTGYAWSGSPPDFDSSPTADEVLSQDAYFFDLRRAFNSRGSPFNRSSTNRFRPRPIAKIDFDLTRFKMAVERTVFGSTSASLFHPGVPNNDNWSSHTLNASASPASYGLGLSLGTTTNFSDFPSTPPVSFVRASASGELLPSGVTINLLQQTGAAGTPTAYTGRITIETATAAPSSSGTYTWGSPTNYPDPSADTTTATYTVPSGVTAIRVSLYAGGAAPAAARLLDQQIIPIGNAANTNVNAVLTNDRYIVPANTSTSGFVYIYPATEMRVFVGGVDDTANWTFTAAAATNLTGSLGSNTATSSAQTGYGTFANRYTLASLTSSTGQVVLTASKTGYSPISRTFTVISQKEATLAAVAPSTNQTGVWLSVAQSTAADPFRLYYAPSNPTDAPVAVAASDLVGSGTKPWFDGITIYIHSVDAENVSLDDGTTPASTALIANDRTRARVDSGVRLWNGRGPLISLPAATYPGRTGLSFVTNDAVYIMGHFNADGTVNSSLSSTGTGGYSGHYPESTSEMLSSVMGDAINILSQPEFSRSGSSPNYRYFPNSGWSDSLSASRRDDSANYSSSWMSSNPSNSNTVDGLNASIQPALMPNLTVASSVTGPGPKPPPSLPSASPAVAASTPSTRTSKFTPAETEISACLLTGIVPTTRSTASGAKQTSGGVHNFPRLSENWAGSVALYIRGSMVAMFESQVANEPWSIRYYQGAIRNWGLHESLRDANHDVPLEPIVLNARRMSYRELDKAAYDTAKTGILALPH